jgi:general secretion pathway protein D
MAELQVGDQLPNVRERDNTRTELLVLITPRAVTNQREVRRVTEELRKRLRAVVPLDMKIR